MQINTWDALWFPKPVSLFRLCSITTHWGCPGLRSLAKRMRMLFSSLQVARGTGRPAREARHLTARPLGGRARCPMEDMTAGTFRQSIDTAIVSALKMRDHLQFFHARYHPLLGLLRTQPNWTTKHNRCAWDPCSRQDFACTSSDARSLDSAFLPT